MSLRASASDSISALCRKAPVIPVLVIDDITTAAPLARSLVEGGLPVLEVTLRTPAALGAIEAMSKVEGAIVGAGTLLTPEDIQRAMDAGAQFGVSPGITEPMLRFLDGVDLPFLPGAATSSEVMRLLERGYTTQKFFPAEANGGATALASIGGPIPQVSFCPTGGVSPENAREYLDLPNVLCVGGSWVAPKRMVQEKDWAGITALARAARTI